MRAIAIAAVTAALLVPAASASASQVSYSGSVLNYDAASGEANGPCSADSTRICLHGRFLSSLG